MLNIKKIKKDFPIFLNQADLSYLDNAATTQVSQTVLSAMTEYYATAHANSHSESYRLGFQALEKYELARNTVADFVNARAEEIIFIPGTTFGLNMLAQTLGKDWKAGDNVVLTRMEHHSNLLPWLEMSKKYGFELRFIELGKDFQLDLSSAEKVIDKNTKAISAVHVSNALGTINPVGKIIALAKKVNALSIVDAAQSIPHIKIDVKKIDCDFLVFGGHKVGGPSGIGVLYGKKERLEKMEPFVVGGGMVTEADFDKAVWKKSPQRFEAGTVNVAGAVGLAQSLSILHKIGMDNVFLHGNALTQYFLEKMRDIKQVRIIGPARATDRIGVISFVVEGAHPHDVASILDRHNVAVRAGHHCTMPLMKLLGINGTVRASFWVYNDKKDVDKLIAGIKDVIKIFNL